MEIQVIETTKIPAGEMAATIRELITSCLYDENVVKSEKDLPPDAVISEGVVRRFAFDPAKLHQPRVSETLVKLIENLSTNFIKGPRGQDGWSFLHVPFTAEGEQWGEHDTADDLVCLAQALKMGGFCMPRRYWNMMPGSMPYVWFSLPTAPEGN